MIAFPDPQSIGILWAAPYCLHDSSNGASILVRLMLTQLRKRGLRCHALSALTFDSPRGTESFPDFQEQISKKNLWYALQDSDVHYDYLRTASQNIDEMTRSEETTFFLRFLMVLEEFKPDVVLLFGDSTLEYSILAESKRRGLHTMRLVLNGYYLHNRFPNTDMVLTETPRSAQYFHENGRANIMPMGTFIDKEHVCIRTENTLQYITVFNPHPTKGVTLFMRLALMAKEKHPEWQFLVVESRGTWSEALAQLGLNPKEFTNVSVARHTMNVHLVYECTKLLLVPSLWFENFGRVAAEAVINGIPVLGSLSGGLPDAVNGGGMCIPVPQKCLDDFSYLPQPEEMADWFEALENMLAPQNYPAWQEKAVAAGQAYDMEKSTDTLLAYIHAMLAGKANIQPQYFWR